MSAHPLTTADHEHRATRRRAARRVADGHRTPPRRTVTDVLSVLADALVAGRPDPRISSLLLDALVQATRRRLPTAPVTAPLATDPMIVHERAVARLAAATACHHICLDPGESRRVARLLPMLDRTPVE